MNQKTKYPAPGLEATTEVEKRARVLECYRATGGPLLGWLTDEANRRGHTGIAMANALGVTTGYIHQLRTGHRRLAHISDMFAQACAKYLGVPPIVVKLLAGRVSVTDFLHPVTTQEEVVERGFRSMLADPAIRELLPVDLEALSPEARRAIVLLYAETTHADVFGARGLPTMLHFLQRAAVIHDENFALADPRLSLVA